MASSGTTAFAPDLAELLEEAFERAGLEMRSGYDFRTGVRSFNFMMAEWANRGINLWTLDEGTISVAAADNSYDVTNAVDVIEHYIRVGTGTAQADYKLERISVSQWAAITNKQVTGRPTQIFVQRLVDRTVLNLWPVPDQAYTLVYWKLARIEDAGGAANTADMPFRFIPALVSGLAYHIATKKPQAAARVPILKQIYEEQFALAADEDRDRASVYLLPDLV
jgi:hypothetical protein